MERVFTIEDPKPVAAEFLVDIDLTTWLGTEDISTVGYVAKSMETGKDVTTTVLNASKNTNTAKVVQPFIQAGSDTASYCVIMTVTSDGTPAAVEVFYLIFSVDANIPQIGPF